MTEYVREWEDVYLALINEVLRGIEFALQPFANSLDAFLAELFSARLPSDWRDRWRSFVADQATLGFLVEPESVEELETWIEQWARFCGLLPSDSAAPGPSAAGRKPVGSGKASEKFFDDKLALAQRQLDEIQRVLEALGPRLDAAREGESVDVETDVDRVEELIWSYHDALESARAEWLTQDLAGNAMERLYSLHTPVSFGLPYYTDEQQAQRAARQERKIKERLRRRNIVMDWVVAGAEAIETANTLAGFAVGGGLACRAVITGGRWAVVKLAASAAVGAAVEQGLEAAARTAGASEQVIRGTRLAVAVISYISLKRKGGFAKSSDRARKPPVPPTPPQKPPTRPSVAPTGPLKNQSGDPEIAAAAARTQPHGQLPKDPRRAPHSATGNSESSSSAVANNQTSPGEVGDKAGSAKPPITNEQGVGVAGANLPRMANQQSYQRFEDLPDTLWQTFPAEVPRPTGPIRLIDGAEYARAREAANAHQSKAQRCVCNWQRKTRYSRNHTRQVWRRSYGSSKQSGLKS